MNNTIQDSNAMDEQREQRKEKLIRIYKIYTVVDWIIAIVVIGIPVFIASLEGLGFDGISIESFMYYLSNAPIIIILPVAIISIAYTVWCAILYVKVWPIKEIPKGFGYWLDWILTIILTAYELFIFYVILF